MAPLITYCLFSLVLISTSFSLHLPVPQPAGIAPSTTTDTPAGSKAEPSEKPVPEVSSTEKSASTKTSVGPKSELTTGNKPTENQDGMTQTIPSQKTSVTVDDTKETDKKQPKPAPQPKDKSNRIVISSELHVPPKEEPSVTNPTIDSSPTINEVTTSKESIPTDVPELSVITNEKVVPVKQGKGDDTSNNQPNAKQKSSPVGLVVDLHVNKTSKDKVNDTKKSPNVLLQSTTSLINPPDQVSEAPAQKPNPIIPIDLVEQTENTETPVDEASNDAQDLLSNGKGQDETSFEGENELSNDPNLNPQIESKIPKTFIKEHPEFPEQEDSHFFAYFVTAVVVFALGYLIVHNKQKILAIIVEGRTGRRRRSHVYRKLNNDKSGNIF